MIQITHGHTTPEIVKLVKELESAGVRCFFGDSIETLRKLVNQLEQGEKQ